MTALPATPAADAPAPLRRGPVSAVRLMATSAVCLLLFIVWALLIRGKLRAMEIASGSMRPTLEVRDHLLVWYGRPGEIARGDIVVIVSPDDQGDDLVKRVVAVPGDRVTKSRGVIEINGEPSAPPGGAVTRTRGRGFEYLLGDDEFFVLGDNRGSSHDSEQFGPIKRDQIVGTLLYRYGPRGRIGPVE